MSTLTAAAEYPPPPKDLSPWPIHWTDELPAVSASSLLDKPAGRLGPVVARDGRFYTGNQRIRFWGVNVAFAANFPTHDDADTLAARFAALGLNAVRFHHMDNQPFPNGIFADGGMEKLSDEALDRLDYFIAALKKQGIYANLNLHVSREWSHGKKWPGYQQLDSYDKVLDIFHPDLIAANKQYARDLLTHVNKYTNTRYADEPAVCMVEINNEDSIFMWGGERRLAELPPPYADVLKQQWNDWLAAKYRTRDRLAVAWKIGESPAGPNLLTGTWNQETHGGAELQADVADGTHTLAIKKVSATDWHVQYTQPIAVRGGQFYTLSFRVQADKDRKISVGVGQAHEPWQNLGLGSAIKLKAGEARQMKLGFMAKQDEPKARVSFTVGQQTGTVTLSDIQFYEGGQQGVADDEDAKAGTVRVNQDGVVGSTGRNRDWYDFLQATDQNYFVGMREFLKNEIGVKAPVTGTIVFGPLGGISQSKMDFVDAHAYWNHPNFPHKAWDSKDWLIDNDAMVDKPDRATLFHLAAARMKDKPFTVTEYNHGAPNEWAAECVPMIASYAALQDWDAVFLFAYSHNANWNKQHITGFFDIEGNATKLPFLPLAARLFVGQSVAPLEKVEDLDGTREEKLDCAAEYWDRVWPWAQAQGITWKVALTRRLENRFAGKTVGFHNVGSMDKPNSTAVDWTAKGAGTGQFTLRDDKAAVFVGFPGGKPVDLGVVKIDELETPFVSLMVVPAEPGQRLDQANRLLLAVVARVENTDMQWTADRRSVGANWGKAPAMVELPKGQLSLVGKWQAKSIKPDGSLGDALPVDSNGQRSTVPLGTSLWYELTRVR